MIIFIQIQKWKPPPQTYTYHNTLVLNSLFPLFKYFQIFPFRSDMWWEKGVERFREKADSEERKCALLQMSVGGVMKILWRQVFFIDLFIF